MRIVGKLLVVALASMVALPGAQARPRMPSLVLVPLAIVGGMAGAALISRKARAHRSFYHRPSARRDRGTLLRARATKPRPVPAVVRAMPVHRAMPVQKPTRATPAGWAGPLFWPHAYDDVFEHAFASPGDDMGSWGRGFGDVIDVMFMPPGREADARGRRASQVAQPPSRGWVNLCGSQVPSAAEATVERIRHAVQPDEAQQAAIGELRAALIRGSERISGACPAQPAATPPERLHMMIARLTAMRQAVLTVQGPLRTFYDSLSDDQKSALERSGSDGEARDARADASPGMNCAAPVTNWPQAQIERVLRPTPAQRAGLEELRQTALGLAQFVASSCPAQMPPTAPERLEAIKDRLAVLRYAANNVSPAYERFYQSLSEAQKARLQAMSRQRAADSQR